MTDDTIPGMAISSDALLVVSGLARGMVMPIPPGELLLGREAGQAGQLGGDRAISRRHARIIRDGEGRLILEDLGSTNGTFLNGTRITGRKQIRASDVIGLGGSKLQVLDQTSAGTATSPAPAEQEQQISVESEWDWLGADPASSPGPLPGPPPAPAYLGRQQVAAGAPYGGPARSYVPDRGGRATVEGQIRGIQQRTENYGENNSSTVWTFRVERYDHTGNRLPPVPVQMRAYGFEGSLHEGDEVSVTGKWKDGTLHTERVENMTTRATVKTRSFKGAVLVALLIFALVAGGLIFVAVSSNASFQENKQEFCQQAEEQTGGKLPGC